LTGWRNEIEQFPDPYLDVPWQDLGARVLTSGSRCRVTLGYPAAGMHDELARRLAEFLGVDRVDLDLDFRAPPGRGPGRSSTSSPWRPARAASASPPPP
jgi:hypothetical protein